MHKAQPIQQTFWVVPGTRIKDDNLMKFMITGGCGFIGVNLAASLVSLGHQVSVFDNEVLGKRKHLDGIAADFILGDIRDKALLVSHLPGVDAVVHLAADTRVVDSISDPTTNFDVNVVGTFSLLEAMRETGVERIVFASTAGAILGAAEPPYDERMAGRPISPYGASKLAAEGYLSAYAGSYGFKAAALRFSNVYGPKSYHKGSVVATFMRQILAKQPLIIYGDGSQTRDFVYVDDLNRGIVVAIESNQAGVYQLGSGNAVTIAELLAALRDIVGSAHKLQVEFRASRAGEIEHSFCNINKARETLGFRPSTPFKDGLATTWEWFLRRFADPGDPSPHENGGQRARL
jgi:UDP-glucose 4-epimerase